MPKDADADAPQDIETALLRVVGVQGNELAAATHLKLPPDAVRRVLDGRKLSAKNLKLFRTALGLPDATPLRKGAELSGTVRVGVSLGGSLTAPGPSPDYWRGVLYAAETMSETVTRLLREQREAADRIAAEAARQITQRSAETVPTPDHSNEPPHPSTD